MGKNLIYIVTIDHQSSTYKNSDYSKYCLNTWKYWCEKNDVDLMVVTKHDERFGKPIWNKELIYERAEGYDKIGLVDSDTMVKWDSPNPFDLFDEEFCELIRSQCTKAYEAESAIIEWSVNGYQSEHLTSDIMKNFIKNRLNDSLKEIGIEPVFTAVDSELLEKTTWFDEDVLGNTATDFFFKRPTEYSKNDKSYDEDDLF